MTPDERSNGTQIGTESELRGQWAGASSKLLRVTADYFLRNLDAFHGNMFARRVNAMVANASATNLS